MNLITRNRALELADEWIAHSNTELETTTLEAIAESPASVIVDIVLRLSHPHRFELMRSLRRLENNKVD